MPYSPAPGPIGLVGIVPKLFLIDGRLLLFGYNGEVENSSFLEPLKSEKRRRFNIIKSFLFNLVPPCSCLKWFKLHGLIRMLFIPVCMVHFNTNRYKVFATRKEPRGGGGVKNTPEENLQYLGSLMSDFDEIFTIYSQINLAYNRIKIFELPLWVTS